ncbi:MULTISPECIES: amidase, partial [unclassified Frankia]|uniref:amidase n=1 Tax=unclassified Frankia TaxID=2632575 RepID=UPI002AD53A0B
LDRIAEVNPAVNAITAVLAESALTEADRVDAAIKGGEPTGPLAGVPFSVKENLDVAGVPTTEGVVAFRDRIASADAPAVGQLRRAGAILLARTNMPDFGMRWHTDNALFGATRNPWDATVSPGGSSGGEAVALATGMSPLGLGNDYGGSLRLPSGAAGTVSLRPTAGRIAMATSTNPYPPTPTLQLFAVDGPMARRVDDVRLAYEQLCGPDPRDPKWVPVPALLSVPQKLRVAVTTDPGESGVDAEVAAAVRRAADALADAGAIVEEVQPPHVLEAAQLWRTLTTAEMQGLLDNLIRPIGSADAVTYLAQSLEHVPVLDLAGYVGGLGRRHAIAADWSLFFADHDLVLGPIGTQPMHHVGFDLGGADNADALWLAHRLVLTINLLGLPTLAVPVGQDGNGLPQGVQLVGDRYHESACLRAGRLIEQALGTITPINPR